MKIQFPETLKACRGPRGSRNRERLGRPNYLRRNWETQWAIGDALVRETEKGSFSAKEAVAARDNPPSRGLRAVQRELELFGIEYSLVMLRYLRATARTFSSNRRYPEFSFFIHGRARDPDRLDAIVNIARRTSGKVTRDYIGNFLDAENALREGTWGQHEEGDTSPSKLYTFLYQNMKSVALPIGENKP